MKKNKLNTSALSLRKEEIANLSDQEMQQLYGGNLVTSATCTCPTGCEGICTSNPTNCNETDDCTTGEITYPNTTNC